MTVDDVEHAGLGERTARARRAADDAIAALAAKGVHAELIGSLARGEYGMHSDVDLLVDWADGQTMTVWGICDEAFGDVEHDLVRLRGLDPDLLAQMRREAVSAVPFSSVPRRMATLARSVTDMTEAVRVLGGGWEAIHDRMDPSLRDHALRSCVLRHAEAAVGRMVKVLRRLLVDADGRAPHGVRWEEGTIAASALPGPEERSAFLPEIEAGRLLGLWERAYEITLLCDGSDEVRAFAGEVEAMHGAIVEAVEAALARFAPDLGEDAAARP